MKNHIWVVQRKQPAQGYVPFNFFDSRSDARAVAKYYNGFAHGTKHARFRVRKYIEAGIGAT